MTGDSEGQMRGECRVCGEVAEVRVTAVPFAPVSLVRKCDACQGTVTLLEIDLLLGMAARRFERRLPTLLPTLALPVRIGDDTLECYRILLSDPLPGPLEHADWARPAAQRLADHVATGAPIDLDELAVACRAELDARDAAVDRPTTSDPQPGEVGTSQAGSDAHTCRTPVGR